MCRSKDRYLSYTKHLDQGVVIYTYNLYTYMYTLIYNPICENRLRRFFHQPIAFLTPYNLKAEFNFMFVIKLTALLQTTFFLNNEIEVLFSQNIEKIKV